MKLFDIKQHNVARKNWPCVPAPTDPNQAPPVRYANDPAIKKLGINGTGCVPCLLKQLIHWYWGEYSVDPETGVPEEIPWNHACWQRLHGLSARWVYRDPEGLFERLRNEENINKTALEKEKISQDAREEEMKTQHDSEEYFSMILAGIEYTIPPP